MFNKLINLIKNSYRGDLLQMKNLIPLMKIIVTLL